MVEKKYKIISIGRSIVDITVILNHIIYEKVRNVLQAKPGDWVEISSEKQLNDIFDSVIGIKSPLSQTDLSHFINTKNIVLSPGSTNLNLFSVFPIKLRNKSALISATGIDEDFNEDIFSLYFADAVRRCEIDHISHRYSGKNPLSIVFLSDSDSEKILASFLGISGRLNVFENIDTEYIYIDAYELNKEDDISQLLGNLIICKKYKIALGLGNVTILKGTLLEKIKFYLKEGLISILSGNIDEFKQIQSDIEIDHIRSYSIFSKVPYMLITQGENGLTGIFGNQILFNKARKIKIITNTSGAGDVAAGAFISGIILNIPPLSIMKRATTNAYKLLMHKI